jgi:hypothetical protein
LRIADHAPMARPYMAAESGGGGEDAMENMAHVPPRLFCLSCAHHDGPAFSHGRAAGLRHGPRRRRLCMCAYVRACVRARVCVCMCVGGGGGDAAPRERRWDINGWGPLSHVHIHPSLLPSMLPCCETSISAIVASGKFSRRLRGLARLIPPFPLNVPL